MAFGNERKREREEGERRARGALRSRERMKWMFEGREKSRLGEETRREKQREEEEEFPVSFAPFLFFASLFARLDRLRQLFHLRMITYYSTLASL